MKLKQQVCNLELSKRLNELGVKQDSLWWWVTNKALKDCEPDTQTYPVVLDNICHKDFLNKSSNAEHISAFTVAELGKLLPKACNKDDYDLEIYWEYESICNVCYKDIHKEQIVFSGDDENEANARAKALIWLIEKGHVKP